MFNARKNIANKILEGKKNQINCIKFIESFNRQAMFFATGCYGYMDCHFLSLAGGHCVN